MAKGRPTLRANWGESRGQKSSGLWRGRRGQGGQGGETDTSLTRRSAQEKSFFFLPGAQLAGRPAASTRGRQHCPPPSLRGFLTTPEAWASYLPRRHCPRWIWACPRWPAKRGSEKTLSLWDSRGAGWTTYKRALLRSVPACSPSGLQRAHIPQQLLLPALPTCGLKVCFPGSVLMGLFLLCLFPMSLMPTRLSPSALSSFLPLRGCTWFPDPHRHSRTSRLGRSAFQAEGTHLLLQMVPHATHWLSV